MKKLIILIIGIVTAVPAFCQLDTLRDGDLYFFPKGYGPTKEPARITIRLKMGDVYDHVMMGGMKYWYMAESNVDSLNQVGDKIRVLSIQVPYTMYFGLAERKKLQDLINSFIVPSNPDPDPVQVDTVDANPSTMTFSADWQRKGEPPLRDSWHGGTINYSTTGEAKYSCVQCTGIEVWGERGPGHGTGSVQVGDETKVVSWTGASYVLPVKIVEFKGLPKNNYEVIIKPVSGDITLDFLVITR